MGASAIAVRAAVEGIVDEAVLRRLAGEFKVTIGPVYGKSGKHQLIQQLRGFNQAARFASWVVLIDLDHDAPCAPAALAAWLPQPAERMCCRVALRAIEAWLIADRPGIARFLGVAQSRIPTDSDAIPNPKLAMVQLAAASRKRAIKDDMVPRPGSGRSEGPAYAARLIEFSTEHWRPDVAVDSSDSLRRCWEKLETLLAAEVL